MVFFSLVPWFLVWIIAGLLDVAHGFPGGLSCHLSKKNWRQFPWKDPVLEATTAVISEHNALDLFCDIDLYMCSVNVGTI